MSGRPDFKTALARIMELSYPPTTLKVPPARAAGHRLARSVLAKGNQPVRPVALADGLAVRESDVLTGRAPPGGTESELGLEGEDLVAGEGYGCIEDAGLSAEEVVPGEDAPGTGVGAALLRLRLPPQSGRRDDALQPGQAVPVAVGAEVPRGGELIYPLSWLVEETELDLSHRAPPGAREGAALGENGEAEEQLPAAEPPRDWDLPARYAAGDIELPRLAPGAPRQMIAVGDWARNREIILPERTVLRAGEVALLGALEVDEVEVYRRPVIGVASLAPPFPTAQRAAEQEEEQGAPQGQCPLVVLCVELARAARIAALPLGFAPRRFRTLIAAIERWVQQVDLLLLAGGSHHGPRCLGLDALLAAGKVALAGVGLEPGGSLSVGEVAGRPVLCIPGTLPDVLTAFVLFARPLAHKYLQPTNFTPLVDVALEYGSRILPPGPAALPVRFGYDAERGMLCTRFGGRVHDPWLDYIRGQALLIADPAYPFADGEVVATYTY
jgi:molybdopterin biosynthesis enzyme